MRAHWLYLKYVARHKWYVLLAGRKTGAPLWRLLIHDASKFLPCEWFPYVRKFYGSPPSLNPAYWSPQAREDDAALWKAAVQIEFDRAWLHHQHANPHHWQHWCLMNDAPAPYPSFRITSQDGGMVHHSLTEYTKPWAPEDNVIQADFTNCLADDGSEENQQRYLMVVRCTEAANARKPVALQMPEHFVREMVADWAGAGRAITGRWEVADWYAKNKGKMLLHPQTLALVERLLRIDFVHERT